MCYLTVNDIPVIVNGVKFIIRPDFLKLFVGLDKEARIPQPNVVNRVLVVSDILNIKCIVCLVLNFPDVIDAVSEAGHLNIFF